MKVWIWIIVVIIIIIGAYFLFRGGSSPAEPVTEETSVQTEALADVETTVGDQVDNAGDQETE